MYLGIDIGTSAVKTVLVDADQRVIASASAALEVSRPKPGFSEQEPDAWVAATIATIDALKASHPRELAAVEGIGLSGHMHGATLLGADHKPLRPCILWNDGRSAAECKILEERWPALRAITGNKAMPGFTAPKLVWVARHEPEIFARTTLVLLPKAYVRLVLTGEAIEDMSDAAGTLWLDVVRRDWSDEALAATGLTRAQMPRLVEGSAPGGRLRADFIERWGMAKAPVVAGSAGDNAAGAVGLGGDPARFRPSCRSAPRACSGQPRTGFAPNPDRAVHAFCHAVPATWHQMGVILSAASCLSWAAGVLGAKEAALLPRSATGPGRPRLSASCLTSPASARRMTMRRSAACSPGSATRPAVTPSCRRCWRASPSPLPIAATRWPRRAPPSARADVIGGGSRSRFWIAVLANVLGFPLHRLAEGETGGAFGAARLGRLAATGEAPDTVCTPPERVETIEPNAELAGAYAEALGAWRKLYPAMAALE